ncbi:MAG: selenium-dependent molybdenum cofactor biosynthesis protein YqeB [Candidatus Eisenbacteria bacterium]
MTLPRVLIAGGGELGSAVAHRLARSGMELFVVDLENPRCVRREVCFAMVNSGGSGIVEGMRARKASSADEAVEIAGAGDIPVLAGDFERIAGEIKPDVFVDARMLKRDQHISRDLAPLVVGLGPGFTAGRDVDIVIETNRGHDLGRVIYDGAAEAHTGVPGEVAGFSHERVIRAPESGTFMSRASLGRMVEKGEVLGVIDDTVCVKSGISGRLRGLVMDGVEVRGGQKIGDVDPRGAGIDHRTISDKGRSVAGGVLEAVMHWWMRERDD